MPKGNNMKRYKIAYTDGWKYRNEESYKIQLNIICDPIRTRYISLKAGLLTIHLNFCWDGASGLTFDTKSSQRGSMIHDALYKLMRLGLLDSVYRKYADELLRDICIEDGMWRWRANMWYKAVRIGAGFATNPKNKKKVIYI